MYFTKFFFNVATYLPCFVKLFPQKNRRNEVTSYRKYWLWLGIPLRRRRWRDSLFRRPDSARWCTAIWSERRCHSGRRCDSRSMRSTRSAGSPAHTARNTSLPCTLHNAQQYTGIALRFAFYVFYIEKSSKTALSLSTFFI